MAENKPNFEKDLERLEETVAALEEGGLSLDDSLKRFEEGIKLAGRCEKALTEAEKKVEILLKNADGKPEAQPFGEEETQPGENQADATKKQDPSQDEEEGDLLF